MNYNELTNVFTDAGISIDKLGISDVDQYNDFESWCCSTWVKTVKKGMVVEINHCHKGRTDTHITIHTATATKYIGKIDIGYWFEPRDITIIGGLVMVKGYVNKYIPYLDGEIDDQPSRAYVEHTFGFNQTELKEYDYPNDWSYDNAQQLQRKMFIDKEQQQLQALISQYTKPLVNTYKWFNI